MQSLLGSLRLDKPGNLRLCVCVLCVCFVCVLAGPSAAVCVGGCLHPLERVISLSWRVFTAVERIRSREGGRQRERRRDYWACWKEEGGSLKKRELASTLQHLFVVCSWHSSRVPGCTVSTNGGTSEHWHLVTMAFRREERRSEGKREETVGLKRAYVNAFIIT